MVNPIYVHRELGHQMTPLLEPAWFVKSLRRKYASDSVLLAYCATTKFCLAAEKYEREPVISFGVCASTSANTKRLKTTKRTVGAVAFGAAALFASLVDSLSKRSRSAHQPSRQVCRDIFMGG